MLTSSDPPPETKRSLDSPSPPPKPTKLSKSAEEEGIDGEQEQSDDQKEQALSKTAMGSAGPRPGVQRYLLAVEYIGTRFFGSQKQPDCRTVVGALESAFQKFVGQPVSIACSSRTDAGVHAVSNVFHVDVERISKRKPGEVLPPHEAGVVRRAVNHFLQKNDGDVMIIDVKCVPIDFHARYRARERTYFYRLFSGPETLSVFDKERAWHVLEDLDVLAMQKACSVLVGHHDFSSFRAAGCQAKSPIKTLDELSITEMLPFLNFPLTTSHTVEMPLPSSFVEAETDVKTRDSSNMYGFGQRRAHRCLLITARAQSFLYHQVRLLVGVLKAVGTGDLSVNDVERILNAKTVTACSPMAPACGLYLGNVNYDFSSCS